MRLLLFLCLLLVQQPRTCPLRFMQTEDKILEVLSACGAVEEKKGGGFLWMSWAQDHTRGWSIDTPHLLSITTCPSGPASTWLSISIVCGCVVHLCTAILRSLHGWIHTTQKARHLQNCTCWGSRIIPLETKAAFLARESGRMRIFTTFSVAIPTARSAGVCIALLNARRSISSVLSQEV